MDVVIRNPFDHAIELIDFKAEAPIRFQARSMNIPANSYEFFRVKMALFREGEFSRQLELFFDDDKANVTIEFTGNIKKVATNQLQDCPSFDNLPSAQKMAKQQQKLQSNIQLKYLTLGNEIEENADEKLSDLLFKPNNLVFLLDISSSMKREGKLDLLKTSMEVLLRSLREKDRISLLTYENDAQLILDKVSVENPDGLIELINALEAKGSTNAIEGIGLAIQTAHSGYISGGNNQVYLVSDGAFDIDAETRRKIKEGKNSGLTVSVLAIKASKTAKRSLKSLSKMGKGKMVLINKEKDKDKILKDVKRMSSY